MESFIEHQDNCTVRRSQPSSHRLQQQHTTNATQTVSTVENDNADLSIGPILSGHPLQRRQSPPSDQQPSSLFYPFVASCATNGSIELQLLPSRHSTDETSLSLSIGTMEQTTMSEVERKSYEKGETSLLLGEREEARIETKRQIEIAELEFAEAKRIRQHARAELNKAQLFREEASRRISATMMQITCHNCKQHFQAPAASVPLPPQPHCTDESTSLAVSYVSSATTEGEKASDRASS